jgi:hypothetical protein
VQNSIALPTSPNLWAGLPGNTMSLTYLRHSWTMERPGRLSEDDQGCCWGGFGGHGNQNIAGHMASLARRAMLSYSGRLHGRFESLSPVN